MAGRKGAIQMSLGLIVAVVFAVVLLSLSITWIQGMIGDITVLTQDLTQDAQTNIQDIFASTNSNFAVWPTNYDLSPGEGIRFKAGIKNDATDSATHQFVINLIPSAASSSICDTRDITTCSSPVSGYSNVYDFMLSWTTVDPTVSSIPPQVEGYKVMTLEVPSRAPKGYYMFNAVSCYDRTDAGSAVTPVSDSCLANNDNIWSAAQPITIHVV